MGERLCSKKNGWSTRFLCGGGGCRYCHNKHDLTLSPPDNNNDESDSHPDNNDVPMATGVMPTLCSRPQLKFPKLLVQATQQKDFNL